MSEQTTEIIRSPLYDGIYNIVKKLKLDNSSDDDDSMDKPSASYEIEQFILNNGECSENYTPSTCYIHHENKLGCLNCHNFKY